jgi:hypothetical protein
MMKVTNAFNGTNVLEWQEFNELLTSLEIVRTGKIESFILLCGMETDVVLIDGVNVKTISHRKENEMTVKGTFNSKEYKALCKRLGVVDIKRSRSEELTIEVNSPVTMNVSYIVGEGLK